MTAKTYFLTGGAEVRLLRPSDAEALADAYRRNRDRIGGFWQDHVLYQRILY